jgi:hypothetical protein
MTETKLYQDTKLDQETKLIQSPFAITRTDTLTETITETIPKTGTMITPLITPIIPPVFGLPSMDLGGGLGSFKRFGPTRFTETFKVGYGANLNDMDLTISNKKGKKVK